MAAAGVVGALRNLRRPPRPARRLARHGAEQPARRQDRPPTRPRHRRHGHPATGRHGQQAAEPQGRRARQALLPAHVDRRDGEELRRLPAPRRPILPGVRRGGASAPAAADAARPSVAAAVLAHGERVHRQHPELVQARRQPRHSGRGVRRGHAPARLLPHVPGPPRRQLHRGLGRLEHGRPYPGRRCAGHHGAATARPGARRAVAHADPGAAEAARRLRGRRAAAQTDRVLGPHRGPGRQPGRRLVGQQRPVDVPDADRRRRPGLRGGLAGHDRLRARHDEGRGAQARRRDGLTAPTSGRSCRAPRRADGRPTS